jgi:hypothetical protein
MGIILPTAPVMGAHPADGPIHKLRDADRSLDELSAVWTLYLTRARIHFDVLVDVVNQTINHVARVAAPLPTADLERPLRAGVHDARSALDNLIHNLGVAAGATEAALKRNAFPIVGDARAWDDYERNRLRELPAETRVRIRAVQPFAQQGPAPWPPHPLELLAALSNADKHRTSLTVHLAPNPPAGRHLLSSFRFTVPREAVDEATTALSDVDKVLDLNLSAVVDGAVVARMRIPVPLEVEKVDVSPLELPLSLSIEHVPGERPLPVIPTLRNATRFAREAVRYIVGGLDDPPVPYPDGLVLYDPTIKG